MQCFKNHPTSLEEIPNQIPTETTEKTSNEKTNICIPNATENTNNQKNI